MYVTRRSRSANARIHTATNAVCPYVVMRHLNESFPFFARRADGGGGGGGAPDPKPEPKPDPKPDPKPGDDKLTLTQEELERKISDALADQQRKADAKATKDKEAADRKAAEEQGEFKKIADTEKARADAAEAKAKRLELHGKLRAHLDEHHAELAKAAPVIAKLIDETAADDDADKAIKAAVAEYEKSLPEKPKGSAGAPAGIPRAGNRAASPKAPQNNERPARRFSTLNYRVG